MKKRIGNTLKAKQFLAIRRALGLSQEKMARLLCATFVSVNRWENGRSAPVTIYLELYRAISRALDDGKTIEQILGAEPTSSGQQLYRLFRAAYGGDRR